MNDHHDCEKKIKIKHDSNDMPDPKIIGEILEVVADKVPKLLSDISDVLYGEGRAKQYAVAVATFYKELTDAGMDNAQAFQLTQQYMSALNVGKTIGSIHMQDDKEIEVDVE